MVDHHHEESLAPLVGDLVDPDPAQTGQTVDRRIDVGPHPLHDGAHRAPGHPKQLFDCALGGAHSQPGGVVVEVPGVPGVVAGPGDSSNGRTVLGAGHPRRVGLEVHLGRAHIERSPTPAAFASVVAWRPATAAAAASLRLCQGANAHDDRLGELVEIDALHHGMGQPAGPLPYASVSHPVLPPRFGPLDSPKPRNQAGCDRGGPSKSPTDVSEERQNGPLDRKRLRSGLGRNGYRAVR